MPAINLLQLRKQLTDLLWNFTDPPAYKKKLENLLEQYSGTSYRPGAEVMRSIATPDLSVPLIVLRELELALYQTIHEHPQAALDNVDLLWADDNLELHAAAARMLGQMPSAESEAVLARIDRWTNVKMDSTAVRSLLENATVSIQRSNPELLVKQAREWCMDDAIAKKEVGLQAITILAEDSNYENLPAIYTSLEILLDHPPVILQAGLSHLFAVLLDRSQIETSFFIRQVLEKNPSEVMSRIARRLLAQLSAQSRTAVQKLLAG